jgi:hypothetical protein
MTRGSLGISPQFLGAAIAAEKKLEPMPVLRTLVLFVIGCSVNLLDTGPRESVFLTL